MRGMAEETWRERWAAEDRAWSDFFDRLMRDDVDNGFYMPGQPRPHIAWWRRLLHIRPKELR